MSTNKPTCPKHNPNTKRSEAKLKRGFGQLAIAKAKTTEIEWTRKHDPLYKIKGIKRHILLKA
jgi:hypothetical protein